MSFKFCEIIDLHKIKQHFMKTLVFLMFFAGLITQANAQAIYNNGAQIVNTSNSYWVVGSGHFTLTSSDNITGFYNLNIKNGASLSVASTSMVTVLGAITNESGYDGLLLESGLGSTASLIHNSSVNATGEFYLTRDAWHIIGAPVSGQDIGDMLLAAGNSIAYSSSGGYYGVTVYNEPTNNWDAYYTSATAGNFTPGKGYLFRRQTLDGSVSFQGALVTDEVNTSVYFSGDEIINGWNCVSNPFTSAIGLNIRAASEDNFLVTNSAVLDDNYEAIYMWDQTVNDYIILNHASGNSYLQSGQGFIVRTSRGGNVRFTPAMRIHRPLTQLKSGHGNDWFELNIKAISGSEVSTADILFGEGMSLGVDVGYDAGALINGNITVFTQLASGNSGIGFGLQCLPLSSLEGIVLPVGLKAGKDGDIVLRLNRSGMPANAHIKFEDRKNGITMELSEKETGYTTQVLKNDAEYGRFYLQFGQSTVNESFDVSVLRVWQNNDCIMIDGLGSTQDVRIALYDIQGRKLRDEYLYRSGLTEGISSAGLSNGIYLLQVFACGQNKTFKLPLITVN